MSRLLKHSIYRLLAACLLFCSGITTAQSEWGVELSIIKPTGDLGILFKGSPGLRITNTSSEVDAFWKKRFFVGIHALGSQADVVNNNYFVGDDPFTNINTGDVFIGGTYRQDYSIWGTLGMQYMARPFRAGPLRPLGILEVQMLGGLAQYEEDNVLSISSTVLGFYGGMAGVGAGLEYLTAGKMTLHFNVIRQYGYAIDDQDTPAYGFFSQWNTFVGVSYLFN